MFFIVKPMESMPLRTVVSVDMEMIGGLTMVIGTEIVLVEDELEEDVEPVKTAFNR